VRAQCGYDIDEDDIKSFRNAYGQLPSGDVAAAFTAALGTKTRARLFVSSLTPEAARAFTDSLAWGSHLQPFWDLLDYPSLYRIFEADFWLLAEAKRAMESAPELNSLNFVFTRVLSFVLRGSPSDHPLRFRYLWARNLYQAEHILHQLFFPEVIQLARALSTDYSAQIAARASICYRIEGQDPETFHQESLTALIYKVAAAESVIDSGREPGCDYERFEIDEVVMHQWSENSLDNHFHARCMFIWVIEHLQNRFEYLIDLVTEFPVVSPMFCHSNSLLSD
jgi:hypothetical protein